MKKPYSVVQYSKFMESIGRTDQHLSFYSFLRKTIKWLKKAVLYLLSTALFNAFFCLQNTKYKQKSKVQELPAQLGRSWISEVQNKTKSSLMTFNCQRSTTTPRGPKKGPTMQNFLGFQNTQTEKQCCWWKGRIEVSCKTV
jgi:cob(I)alamin adenosyltransferase